MKTKKKLELENGYANIENCGICAYCSLFCLLGGSIIVNLGAQGSNFSNYEES